MGVEGEEDTAEHEAQWKEVVDVGGRAQLQGEGGWRIENPDSVEIVVVFQAQTLGLPQSWPLKGNLQLVVVDTSSALSRELLAGFPQGLTCASWGKTQNLLPPSPEFLLLHPEDHVFPSGQLRHFLPLPPQTNM